MRLSGRYAYDSHRRSWKRWKNRGEENGVCIDHREAGEEPEISNDEKK